MTPLASAFAKALGFLRVPGITRLLVGCVLLSATLLAGFIAGIVALLLRTTWFSAPWAETAADTLGGIFGVLCAWFLFPALLPLIAGFFAEAAAEKIERAEYGAAPAPAAQGNFLLTLGHDLRFAALALGLNILLLPVYFIPLVNIAAYYGVNGYLLGREFFLMAASRRMGRKRAESLRRGQARTVFLAGLGIALLANIPLANLVAPFFGIALMVHLARGLHLQGPGRD